MASLRNYQHRANTKGFTLIEVIVVLGLIALVVSFSGVGMDVYRRQILETETAKLVGLLQTARNRSMNNVDQSPYGVNITATEFILFHGAVNEPVAYNSAVTVSPLGQIVFGQLSGASTQGTTTLSMGAGTSTIVIGSNGLINW